MSEASGESGKDYELSDGGKMMLRKVLGCLAAATLVATPAAAQTASRAPSTVAEHQEVAGSLWLPLLIGLGAAIVLALVVFDGDDDELPASP